MVVVVVVVCVQYTPSLTSYPELCRHPLAETIAFLVYFPLSAGNALFFKCQLNKAWDKRRRV